MKILQYSKIISTQSERDNKATDSCLKTSISETFIMYYKAPGNEKNIDNIPFDITLTNIQQWVKYSIQS